MEYIAHGDLAQYIDNHGEKAVSEVKEITRQILSGLVVMHSRQICHRDLKPQVSRQNGPLSPKTILIVLQNILIKSPSPIWVKITDFGISKKSLGTSLRTSCGTTCYMAPELIGLLPTRMKVGAGDSYTNAVDIWALGAVVHKILTSEIPFRDTYTDNSTTFLSGPDLGSMSHQSVKLDIALLSAYCRNSKRFPTECLERNNVTIDGIGFVGSLMVARPAGRVTAAGALNTVWLGGTEAPTL